MFRKQRIKAMTALTLSAAMALLSVCPAMGEEFTPDVSEEVVNSPAVPYDTADIMADDAKADSNGLYHGYNTSGNTYCGLICVRDDGLYDLPVGGKKLTIEGISYDPATHTLSLNNVNIGCAYDDILRHDKKGGLCFCGRQVEDWREYKGEMRNFGLRYPDYTIVLTGHNYLGGYSTFQRMHCFAGHQDIISENNKVTTHFDYALYNDDNNYQNYSYEGNGEYRHLGSRSVTFTGSGDITICGKVDDEVSVNTALPVWLSDDCEGKNLMAAKEWMYGSIDFCLDHYNTINYTSSYNTVYGEPGYIGCTYEQYYQLPHHREIYCQIGGEAPVKQELSSNRVRALLETVHKDLGEIGGHQVSVDYCDKYVYQGRKLAFLYDSDYERYDTKNVDGSLFYLQVGVYDNNYGCWCYYEDWPLTIKIKGDGVNVSKDKPTKPGFSFSFKKDKDDKLLDKKFRKALKDYFKNDANLLPFDIYPADIKFCDTTFYGFSYRKWYPDIPGKFKKLYKNPAKFEDYRKKQIKKQLKIKGDTIKKINLLGEHIYFVNNHGAGYELRRKLKYGKDFDASLSGNYIVINGKGNYDGTIIVNNPYKNDEFYYKWFACDYYISKLDYED